MVEDGRHARLARSRWRLLVVGVGGQGVLTAARSLGEAALLCGCEVVVGQLHGMSQRGGSVESSVILGPGKTSFVPDGSADALLGLEPLEVLRARRKLSPRTIAVVSVGCIVPPALALSGKEYPDLATILERVRRSVGVLVAIDAPALAAAAGDVRALNAVMLGALAGAVVLPFGREQLESALSRQASPRAREVNRLAFESGFRVGASAVGAGPVCEKLEPPRAAGRTVVCEQVVRPPIGS
jgi:indolepyruvate ferredoxin oxidoreductase beta subunit